MFPHLPLQNNLCNIAVLAHKYVTLQFSSFLFRMFQSTNFLSAGRELLPSRLIPPYEVKQQHLPLKETLHKHLLDNAYQIEAATKIKFLSVLNTFEATIKSKNSSFYWQSYVKYQHPLLLLLLNLLSTSSPPCTS